MTVTVMCLSALSNIILLYISNEVAPFLSRTDTIEYFHGPQSIVLGTEVVKSKLMTDDTLNFILADKRAVTGVIMAVLQGLKS